MWIFDFDHDKLDWDELFAFSRLIYVFYSMRIIQRSQVWANASGPNWEEIINNISSVGLGRYTQAHISRWLTLPILDRALKPENINCLDGYMSCFLCLVFVSVLRGAQYQGSRHWPYWCQSCVTESLLGPGPVSTWDSIQQHQQLHLNCILVYSMRWAALQRHSDSMPHSQSQPDNAASLEVVIVLTGMRLESSM